MGKLKRQERLCPKIKALPKKRNLILTGNVKTVEIPFRPPPHPTPVQAAIRLAPSRMSVAIAQTVVDPERSTLSFYDYVAY